jgi:polar amino acid transport system ATP-binding protein
MLSGLFSHSAAGAADFSHLEQASVEFRHVDKRYGDHQVLNDINLTITPGEVVAILGPSGSGKSTLIRLINQLETLSGGRFWSTTSLPQSSPVAGCASCAAAWGLCSSSSIFTPTSPPARTSPWRWSTFTAGSRSRPRALALLEKVGMLEKAHHFPAELSGGQQQRVAIARALASSPQIILFDEPTSALDPEMIGEVLYVMKALAHSGITMIVVTHEMQFAREIADRIVFIDGGQILETAPPAQFFSQPSHPRAQRFLQKVLNPLHQEHL